VQSEPKINRKKGSFKLSYKNTQAQQIALGTLWNQFYNKYREHPAFLLGRNTEFDVVI
jgi:hypothetical protein